MRLSARCRSAAGWAAAGAVCLTLLVGKATADHADIDCGWYGPHRAAIDCQDPKRARCWADLQGLGYCKAECTCDAPSSPAAGAPKPQPLNLVSGYNYVVNGGIASWRPCGTDDLITLPAARIVSVVAGGSCGGVALPPSTRYTISIRPP
jgi:hypothetical protein